MNQLSTISKELIKFVLLGKSVSYKCRYLYIIGSKPNCVEPRIIPVVQIFTSRKNPLQGQVSCNISKKSI